MERDQIIELLGVAKPLSRSEREIVESDGVVPTLISILIDEELGAQDHPTGGYAPIHAARLLGELRAEAAIGPLFDVLRTTDWDAIIHDQIIQSLPKVGAAVVEPGFAAYTESEDEEFRASVSHVLADCGVRDERIYQLLIDRFEADLGDTGLDLGTYGDKRALPNLIAAFDEFEIVEGDDAAFANGMLTDLRENIELLGGALDALQEAKFEIAMTPVEIVQPATRRERPGRNEPCWCGSKKKYKKCHLETDEADALNH